MSARNDKLLLIKRLFHQIERECELELRLHEELLLDDSASRKINPKINMFLQVYFEVVKYIMNINEVPKNTYAVRAYMTSDDHVQRVELYSAQLPVESDKFELDVQWVDT